MRPCTPVALIAALAAPFFTADATLAQRIGPGAGGPAAQEREVVAQFDADGDGRLGASERAQARAWLQTQPQAGRGGPGGPGGPAGGLPGARGGRGGLGGPPPSGSFPPGGRGRAGFPPDGGGRGGFGGGGRAAMAPSSPGVSLSPGDVTRYANEPLYDPATLRTVFLRFESADWEQELADFHDTDVEVPAQVTVDGVVYEDVGVSFRGASSFMMVPAGSKRSLNLSFDFVHDGQDLGGYRTLNLLNGNGDPSFLRTALYAHIAGQYIAAPKVNFVRVVVNGESWGIYASAQQFNKDFTREFFASDEGARWKVPGSPNGRGGMQYLGDDVDAYRTTYQIKSKDDPESWSALIGLFRTLEQTPPSDLDAALAPILDVDGALRFLALDVALANSDGFWTRASDYSLYLDPEGRFHILPHDMNEGLGVGGSARLDPLVGLDDDSKALRSSLLAVPALRERYLTYVREIAETWLDWSRIGPVAEQYRALIDADVRRDTRKLYGNDAFDSSYEALRSFVEARRAYLLGES